MSFEQGFKSASGCESSPSMIHEAMEHVKTTWSNVLHGKASAAEYLEATAEMAVVAAGAIALKQGSKMIVSRFGATEDIVAQQIRQNFKTMRETERAVVKEIRAAAEANAEWLKTARRTPDGAIIVDWPYKFSAAYGSPEMHPWSAMTGKPWSSMGTRKPEAYDKLVAAAKGDRHGLTNRPIDPTVWGLRRAISEDLKNKNAQPVFLPDAAKVGASLASKFKISG